MTMVRACDLLGVARSSVYRHLAGGRVSTLTIPQADRNYPNRLTAEEQAAIVARASGHASLLVGGHGLPS